MYENLAVLAIFAFLYSIVAGGTERTPFSGPIIFTVFGLDFRPIGLGFLDVTVDTQMLRYIADVTLALVTWVAFGAAVVEPFYEYFNWKVVVFAILSLTLIRMLPMFLSLTGIGD